MLSRGSWVHAEVARERVHDTRSQVVACVLALLALLALVACSDAANDAPATTAGTSAPSPVSAGGAGSPAAPAAGSSSTMPPGVGAAMDAGKPPVVGGSASPAPDAAVSTDAGTAAQDATTPPPADAGSTLPPISDPGATGTFGVERIETIAGLDTHGLIIPAELGRDGVKHPVLVWINGASAGFASYRTMLDNVATHGFFVISDKQSGFDSAPEVTAQRAAIDWIIEQATTMGSPYFGVIDTTRIAIGGHSLGSVSSFGNVKDPRVKTSIHMAGGIVGNPEGVDEGWLQDLHAPATFLCGARDTNGLPRCRSDFAAIPAGVPVFFGILAGVTHTGEFSEPNGGRWGRVLIAWLRWQLADDATFAPSFTGSDCEFCKGDWTAMKQAID
jgi:hypothetical protein